MGYMFRYSPGFVQVAEWARDGLLGEIFAIRAHMSTHVDLAERTEQSRHRGGILYDLGGHMLDQIVWLLGRPTRVTTVLRNDATPELPGYADNTLAVFEFDRAAGHPRYRRDGAAPDGAPLRGVRHPRHGHRRAVRPGRHASAWPLSEPAGGSTLPVSTSLSLPEVSRQQLYERELVAFVGVLRGAAAARPLDRARAAGAGNAAARDWPHRLSRKALAKPANLPYSSQLVSNLFRIVVGKRIARLHV